MIIGINGRVGSGKDTVGRIIQYLIRDKQNDGFSANVKLEDTLNLTISDPYHSGWEIKKFAAKLKQIASLLTGIPVEKFESQDFKKTDLPECWHTFDNTHHYLPPMTVREFLQKLGTEAIRDNIHTNAWVNALFADYTMIYPKGFNPENKPIDEQTAIMWGRTPNWIITDCRFPNEAQAIKDKGGVVIRVTRPGENLADLHPSETSLDNWKFDYLLENTGSINDLKDKVAFFLTINKLL